MVIETSGRKTRTVRDRLGLEKIYMVEYWGPILDNGTSNALRSPLTTELRTLRPKFGIRRQNSIRITLQLTKIFWSKMVNTLAA